MPVCPNCNEDNPARAKFCLSCGEPLAGAPAPKRESRRTVTVVFTDVAGFTSTAEQTDPETLRNFMSRYFDEMAAVIGRHGGTVEKFIGDAIMAVFGIPQLHEDDAVRAVRAAWEMREVLERLNAELEKTRDVRLRIRTGVNTGEVVAGDASGSQQLVTGDAVNVAARLEQNAPPGEILIGEATYRLVRDAVDVEAVQPVAAKGKTERVTAYRLTGVTPGAPGFARRSDAPMVGREHEQSLLLQAFERAVRERSCHLFTILGGPGVGKSRLVAEALTAFEDQATIMSGRCLPYGEGITYWPVMEAITEVAGVRDDDTAEQAREKVAALARGADNEERIVGALIEVSGLGSGSSSGEIPLAVRKTFELLARQRPLVVVFDDIHWAEPTFLDLVENIADWSRDAPILLVCVARQELLDRRAGWAGGKLNATSILLEPLTEKESERLVGNLLGAADLDQETRKRIAEAAEGNPLFVEEMLAMLIDDGTLQRRNGDWVLARALSSLAVPPTIQALLAARIDRLKDEERAVLERAAVVGKVFWRGSVQALWPEQRAETLDASLMTLVRKELIRQEPASFAGEETFRFRHILIRDAAYHAMPKEQRAELHERFVAWLSDIVGDRITEYEEIIGYHLEEAYRYVVELGGMSEWAKRLAEGAATKLLGAGTRAFGRGDLPATVKLLTRAAALLPEHDTRRLDALCSIADSLLEMGELKRAAEISREALEQAHAAGREAIEWRARLIADHLRTIAAPGDLKESEELARAAIEVFERLDDHRGLAQAWTMIAVLVWTQFNARATEEALERSLEHARLANDRSIESQNVPWLFLAVGVGERPAAEVLEVAERIAERYRGLPTAEAFFLLIRAQHEANVGNLEESRRLHAAGTAMLEELGQRVTAAAVTQGMGSIERGFGNLDIAERLLRQGYETLDRFGEKSFLSTIAADLANALADVGRYDEVEEFVRIAKESGDPLDVATEYLWRLAQAKLAAWRGDQDETLQLAQEALTLVDSGDFILMRANARTAVARAYSLIGRRSEARALIEEALDMLERKGVGHFAERAREQLAELDGA